MDSVSAQPKKKSLVKVRQELIALLSGILFGFGLGLSQMIDRDRVLGFLNITRQWDPTLLFVFGGAIAVTIGAFRYILQRPHPLFSRKFYLPSKTAIDLPLILGAVLFGVGWGITGYCPGPAITALVLGIFNPVLFLVAMVAGSFACQKLLIRIKQQLNPQKSSTP